MRAQRTADGARPSDARSPDVPPAPGLVGSWRYGPDDQHLTLDAAAAAILRLPEHRPGWPLSLDRALKLFHPDDRMDVSLRLQTAHLTGAGFEREFRLADEAGGETVRMTGACAQSAGGAPGVAGTIVGIASRPATASAVSATALEQAVIAADAGIWSLDLATLTLSLSPTACRMYGLPDGHSGLLSREQWLALVDAETVAAAEARLGSAHPDKAHDLEIRLRDPARPRWLRQIGRVARDAAGDPVMVTGLVIDITESKEMELALREAERRFQVAEEAASIGCYATGADQRAYCSPGFYRMSGLPLDTPWLPFSEFMELVHPDDRAYFINEVETALVRGDNYNAEFRIVRADTGEVRWVHSRAKFITDADGNVLRSIGANVDITDRKRAEESLRQSEALNRSIIEASADSVMFLDLEGRLQFINQSGLRLAEIDDFGPLAGREWTGFWPEEVRPAIERALQRARRGAVGRYTARNPTAKGRDKWWDVMVTSTPAIGEDQPKLLLIARDVTEQRRTLDGVEWAANHDALTGLANRRSFRDAFTRALRQARREGSQLGVLLMDLDHFKEANDLYGHDAGDTVLKAVAARLRETVGEAECIARLGGDEFAVVLRGVHSADDLCAVGAAVLRKLREPLMLREQMLNCSASLGAAVYPHHGSTVETLLKSADLAVYTAKSEARGSVKLFDPGMRTAMRQHAAQMRLARTAVARGAIMPYYQPKVRLSDGKVAGLEALLRLTDTRGRLRQPADVVAAFEDVELARAIGETMRTSILDDMRGWLDAGLEFGHVSMNVSAAELRRADFVERLLGALVERGLATSTLELEITETVFFDLGTGQIERSLAQLHEAGVRIALDDFGTGYASLSHLKRFPVSTLKIDQSFVRQVEERHDDAVIVRALLGLGRNLGVDVVAEGIETEANVAFLRRHGCQIGQGFLFSKPVPAADVPAMLRGRFSA